MSLTAKAARHFRHRAACLEAGETYCLEPDPRDTIGVVCDRPAGHDGPHAAHGDDLDVPLWTWPDDDDKWTAGDAG